MFCPYRMLSAVRSPRSAFSSLVVPEVASLVSGSATAAEGLKRYYLLCRIEDGWVNERFRTSHCTAIFVCGFCYGLDGLVAGRLQSAGGLQ